MVGMDGIRQGKGPARVWAWSTGRRFAPIVAIAAVVVLLAIPAGATAHRSADSGETFTYLKFTGSVVSGWDPAVMTGGAAVMFANMYETLTHYNWKQGRIDPQLATSWRKSADGLRWTFQLRPNVRFHTGRVMTAAAVRDAIVRTIKTKLGASAIWDPVRRIRVNSPTSLTFVLKYPAAIDRIASAGQAAFIYDTQAAGTGSLTAWFAQNRDAGTGPYTLGQYNPGGEFELILDQFPNYWGGWKATQYKRVAYRVVPDPNTAAQLLRGGDVDYIAYLPPQLWRSIGNTARSTRAKSVFNFYFFLNTLKPGLSDVRVRRGLAYGIDYPGIVSVLQGSVTRSGIIPPGLLGYSKKAPVYSYSTKKATELLNAAGYGPGKQQLTLNLTYVQGQPAMQAASTIIQSSLAKLNVNVNIQALQFPALAGRALSADKAQRQDLTWFAYGPEYPTASGAFRVLYRTEATPFRNFSYSSVPALDRLIDDAVRAEGVDPKRAEQIYMQMQKLAFDSAAVLPMFTQTYERAMLRSVTGYVDNPAYPNVVFVHSLRFRQ